MSSDRLTLSSYPKAILHVDADAFFTSVEQALTPSLRNRPVVTGAERNIIACASYEAKRLGIARGMALYEARKICPSLQVLPSDYETYSLYSKKMFDIIRRFTPIVEEYSVDEAFADITGMRRCFHASYPEIASMVTKEIHDELGITASVGLSLSKSLAKLGSSFRKPKGLTAVPGRYIHVLLQRTALSDVWGFGPNTVSLLGKFGLKTAYDYICQSEEWASRQLHKPGLEMWHELRGNSVLPVTTEEQEVYASINKSKTFTPASSNKDYVFARMVKNLESAFIKLRRYSLRAGRLSVILRDKDFRHTGLEACLNRSTSSSMSALPLARELFEAVFDGRIAYRATMIVLGKIDTDRQEQYSLFTSPLKIEALRRLSKVVDAAAALYGKHKLSSGATMYLHQSIINDREIAPARRSLELPGESLRKRIKIPRMDVRI